MLLKSKQVIIDGHSLRLNKSSNLNICLNVANHIQYRYCTYLKYDDSMNENLGTKHFRAAGLDTQHIIGDIKRVGGGGQNTLAIRGGDQKRETTGRMSSVSSRYQTRRENRDTVWTHVAVRLHVSVSASR